MRVPTTEAVQRAVVQRDRPRGHLAGVGVGAGLFRAHSGAGDLIVIVAVGVAGIWRLDYDGWRGVAGIWAGASSWSGRSHLGVFFFLLR